MLQSRRFVDSYHIPTGAWNMKKISNLLTMATILLAFSVNAEDFIELKDNSTILGTWVVKAEAAALHKEKKLLQSEWTFAKNGFMTSKSKDKRMSGYGGNSLKVKYSVENGMIHKQTSPGREKYEDCKVISMEGKDMVMHCKFNYFFLTKK